MRIATGILAAVTAAGTAACSLPDKTQYAPYGCNGQPLPTTAFDPITIRGRVINPVTQDPIRGAQVEVFRNGGPYFPTTTGADGRFMQQARTTGEAADVSIRVSYHGVEDPQDPNLDTYFYPAAPVTDDLDVGDLQILSGGVAAGLMNEVQIALDPTKILLAVTAVDCNDVPQAHAVVSTDPKGAPIRYLVDGPTGPRPSLTATATDAVSGTGFAANVPITNAAKNTSTITLGGTLPMPNDSAKVMTLRSHPITDIKPGVLIQAEIQP